MRSGVSAWALKMNSRSRRGRPVQAQKASRTVSRGVRAGVGDGEVGQQIDQRRVPAQPPGVDQGGRQQRAERLGHRADAQQGVGGHRRRSPQLADAEALQEGDLAALDDRDGGAGDAQLGELRRDVGLERGQPLAGQRQRRDAGQVGRASSPGAWRPASPPAPPRGSRPAPGRPADEP